MYRFCHKSIHYFLAGALSLFSGAAKAAAGINPAVPHVFRRAIRPFMLAILSVAAFGGVALKAAVPSEVEGSWEKVACPFDASKALLPVTCGRLKVPEN